MTEKGVVRAINGNLIAVAPDKSAACFGCMNQECRENGGIITAENPLGLPLRQGQAVEVQAPGVSVVGQAFAALLPPVLCFAAAYVLIRRFLPGAGEGFAIGAGIIFLFAASFVILKVRKRIPAGREYSVVRILEPLA